MPSYYAIKGSIEALETTTRYYNIATYARENLKNTTTPILYV